jgi:hypothetical protein
MKMVLMWVMIEFTESGDQKVFKFLRSNPSVEDSGLMMDLASGFVLNIPIMSGLMILWPIEPEMVDRSEF